MDLASLGSGSRGNATLVRAGGSTVLLDCGFSLKELERRLARLDLVPADLDAVLVSHEHHDHIGGVGPLARRHDLPVWISRGSLRNARDPRYPRVRHFRAGTWFRVGDLEILPYTVPHDAAEACQFVFQAAGRRLGVLTDCGTITPHVVDVLRDCHGLVLECNHDPVMLRSGPYPPALRARVGGDFGHLSNAQAVSLLQRLAENPPDYLWLAHLSEQNNHVDAVRAALAGLPAAHRPAYAIWSQDEVSGWLSV